jgi:type II secretory pathway pseudopilin PulG
MAALLVGLRVMSIMLGAALPVWQTAITRERDAEAHRMTLSSTAPRRFNRRTETP